MPHVLTQDDVYSGYAIPKGSFVFANVWYDAYSFDGETLKFMCMLRSIMRDETLYAKPNTFNPDRFMKTVSDAEDKKRDPRTYVFGFGRRLVTMVYLVLLTHLEPFKSMSRCSSRRIIRLDTDCIHDCHLELQKNQ